MKNLLVLAPYVFLPARSGGQNLIAGFCEALSRHTRLTVCSCEGNAPEAPLTYTLLDWLGTGKMRYFNPSALARLEQYILAEEIAWIIVEHPYLGWMGKQLSEQTGTPWMVHTHNVEFDRWKQAGKWWWPALKWYEKWVLRKAGLVSYLSPEDLALFQELTKRGNDHFVNIPYGISNAALPDAALRNTARQEWLQTLNLPESGVIFGFNGALDYGPNKEAVHILMNQWIPILKQAMNVPFRVIICGRNASTEVQQNIKAEQACYYAGFVRSIREVNLATDVFLNPVSSGGGIKTKLVDALSAGTAAISFASGAQGIPIEIAGSALKIISFSSSGSIAIVVQELLDARPAVPESFFQYFQWDHIITRLLRRLS